ncbi:MAG: hypothetical protein DWQ44_00120 [Bacteroidetes bacterium]|nr:MAG: hypothetical protein DWQ33_05070 [Bacteroidota bacterium]REK06035.1 MAG: hypothetical protein DWQ39_04210 [Bacteroidota bacterium]REK37093.1 MAG: hypothetical protein DWQ44_00120 [Bacteroidota bacterium]REK47514.1 MAG: hypothetical protein DWQ48_12325 [Bacteroidota bacterium]
MEGTLVITLGNLTFLIHAWITDKKHKYLHMISSAFILFGVLLLWMLSSLGCFMPDEEWWCLAAIAPYPLGWLMQCPILIVERNNKRKIRVKPGTPTS